MLAVLRQISSYLGHALRVLTALTSAMLPGVGLIGAEAAPPPLSGAKEVQVASSASDQALDMRIAPGAPEGSGMPSFDVSPGRFGPAGQPMPALAPGEILIPMGARSPVIYPIDPGESPPATGGASTSPGSPPIRPLSPQAQSCSVAARALQERMAGIADGDPADLNDNPSAAGAVVAWANACLTTTPADGDGFDVPTIRQVVGYLSDEQGPFCTAFLANPQRIVSARHCFAPRDARSSKRAELVATCSPFTPCAHLTFTTFEAVARSTPIARLVRPTPVVGRVVDDLTDIIELEAATVLAGPAVHVAEPVAHDKLFVGGLLPYYTAGGPQQPAELRWSKSFTDFKEACTVRRVGVNGCVYHDCQALWAFSGAPLVAAASKAGGGTVTVVGMHLGGPVVGRSCSSENEMAANRAIALVSSPQP